MTTRKYVLVATAVVVGAIAATMPAFATPTAPATKLDVSSLASAESNVVKVLHSYKATAARKARYMSGLAKQTAAANKFNSALGTAPSTTTTAKSTAAKTTTSVSVNLITGDPAQYDIETVTSPVRPAPRTVTVSAFDSATGQTLATWTAGSYSTLLNNPSDLWLDWGDTGATGSSTDTLVLDTTYSGPSWSGPASVTVSHADLLNADIGVVAAFAGQPGYGPSKSAAAVL